jgi:hypothetical protein
MLLERACVAHDSGVRLQQVEVLGVACVIICIRPKVINSGSSGRNYTRNSGSGPLPLPL